MGIEPLVRRHSGISKTIYLLKIIGIKFIFSPVLKWTGTNACKGWKIVGVVFIHT